MQRSSLSVLIVLTTAACGPAMGGEGATDGSADAEGAVLTTAAAPTTAVLEKATAVTALATVAPARQTEADACVNYDTITAALGSRTIDCLGTIGPDSYAIDAKGYLVPRFDKCTQDPPSGGEKDVYADILSLLSVQRRETATDAARCIAGRYEAWAKTFATTGIRYCPAWKRVRTLNAPTEKTVAAIAETLPELPQKPGGAVPSIPHENYVMELRFPEKRDDRCKDEADCARKCSAGFKGMWVSGQGTQAVIDPSYWLVTLNFTGTNPFMAPGYYHLMSYAGTVPGAVYGHRNRKGEACSRWVIDAHVLLTLKLDCLDPADVTTCLTICEETPPDTAGTESSKSY